MAHYTKREAKEWARENMRGHWSTAITPFSPDGEIYAAGLQSNMRHWLKIGGQGIGITWLTGEFWSLTIEERKRVCETLWTAECAALANDAGRPIGG